MKKLFLCLVLGIFLISFINAEECKMARPYFGSVNCEKGAWSEEIEVYDGESWTCNTENCEIRGLVPNDVTCSGWGTTSRLEIYNQYGTNIVPNCDSTIHPLGEECADLFPKTLKKGDKISIIFSCNSGNVEGSPRVIIRYEKLQLELNIDSGHSSIPNTEFCNVNSVWNQYSNKQLSDNNRLKSMSLSNSQEIQGSEGLSNIPSSSNLVSDLKPSQLNYGQGYWFIYDWVERPALITSSYDGQDVWCNPIDHSLTKLEQVSTRGSNCYLIPTNKLSETVACCSTDECRGRYTNQEVLCTDDFKCGFEKSCLSDLDCGSSERCEENGDNYNLIKSYCDKSQFDSYGKGSCKNKKESVKCCSGNDGGPNTCGSGNYCDYQTGCKEVTYKTAEGNVKTGVGGEKIIKKDSNNKITGLVAGSSESSGTSSKNLFLIAIMVFVVGLISLVLFLNKKGNTVEPTSAPQKSSFGHCTFCGNPLKFGSVFCSYCGKQSKGKI